MIIFEGYRNIFFAAVLTSYFIILCLLAVYGVHRLFLIYLYYKYYKRTQHTVPLSFNDKEYPAVTVQLPIYNEFYVVERLINSVAALSYPRHLLHIQVLDDSTDQTSPLARKTVERLQEEGFNIQYLHRPNRVDFKAGALKEGLASTSDEFIAIFDADFMPQAEFLKKTIHYFKDERVGMVQARWGYVNRTYSLLTRIQAMFLDGHFMIEHTARHFSGRFFNFNGTAGIWRRETIVDAGGWNGETLTEDIDLSYRAQMKGWKFVFLPHLVVPSELPVNIFSYKNQQHRWTKGSIQVSKRILPRLWASSLPLRIKIEATFHLASNLNYILMVILAILMPLAVMIREELNFNIPLFYLIELSVFFLTIVNISLFYLISQRELYKDWWKRLLDLPALFMVGIGMSINNALAVCEALVSYETPFERTAKYCIESPDDTWKGKQYNTLRSMLFIPEGFLTIYVCLFLILFIKAHIWGALPFMLLFCAGYIYVMCLSIIHAWR